MTASLTVIVPFADAEDSLSTTLLSLDGSRAEQIGFVLVDDGSRDDTLSVLDAFAADRNDVTVLRQKNRRGFGAARNLGLEAVDSDWIAFLDGDDFVEHGYYPRLLEAAEELGCDFVRTDHVRVDGPHREVMRVPSEFRDGTVGDPRDGIGRLGRASAVESSDVWAGIYHRRLLDAGLLEFRTDLTSHEDVPWMWRLHLKAASFSVSGLRGVFHQAGVGPSATDALDVVRALDAMVAEVQADPESARFLPKAVFWHLSTVAKTLRRADQRDRPRAQTLALLCTESLKALPRAPRDEALARLERNDQTLIEGLLRA